jgi:hypothetical protein
MPASYEHVVGSMLNQGGHGTVEGVVAAVKVARGPPQSLSGGPHHRVQCSFLTLLSHSTLISLLSLTFQEEMSVESN